MAPAARDSNGNFLGASALITMSESLIANADRSILETKSFSVCKFVSLMWCHWRRDFTRLETRFYASVITILETQFYLDASLVMLIRDAFCFPNAWENILETRFIKTRLGIYFGEASENMHLQLECLL